MNYDLNNNIVNDKDLNSMKINNGNKNIKFIFIFILIIVIIFIFIKYHSSSKNDDIINNGNIDNVENSDEIIDDVKNIEVHDDFSFTVHSIDNEIKISNLCDINDFVSVCNYINNNSLSYGDDFIFLKDGVFVQEDDLLKNNSIYIFTENFLDCQISGDCNVCYQFDFDNWEYNQLECNKSNMLFSDSNYEIYLNVNEDTNDILHYFVFDKLKEKAYPAYNIEGEYYYFISINDEIVGLFNLNTKKVLYDYDDYSCSYHSDTTIYICDSNSTTIVNKDEKNGVISLDNYEFLIPLEYSSIYEDDEKNFIVKKDNKMGVYSNDGKILLDVIYDYIAYSKYFGYLTINGDNLVIYDKAFKEIENNDESLLNMYSSALNLYNKNVNDNDVDINYLTLYTANSFYWTSDAIFAKHNLSIPFYEVNSIDEEKKYLFKYNGKQYNDVELIIYDYYSVCNNKSPLMYVVKDKKAYKVDSSDIIIGEANCF